MSSACALIIVTTTEGCSVRSCLYSVQRKTRRDEYCNFAPKKTRIHHEILRGYSHTERRYWISLAGAHEASTKTLHYCGRISKGTMSQCLHKPCKFNKKKFANTFRNDELKYKVPVLTYNAIWYNSASVRLSVRHKTVLYQNGYK